MKKFFLKHCKLYRKMVCKFFGRYNVPTINIPMSIYGNFDYCYLGFDETGEVKKGFKNIFDAIKNRGNLGLTVMYDKY